MSLGKTVLVMVNLLVFLANPGLSQTIEPVWLSEHSSDPATVLEMARRRHEAYQVLFEAGAISRIQAERAAEQYRTLLEQYNTEQDSDNSTLPPHSDPCNELDAIVDDLKRMRRVFDILFPLYREGAFPRFRWRLSSLTIKSN